MKTTQRLIAGLVVLAGLGYATSAMSVYNPPLPPPKPPVASAPGGTGDSKPAKNNKSVHELSPSDPCDVAKLTETIEGFERQKAALLEELAQIRAAKAEAMAAPKAEPVTVAAPFDSKIRDREQRLSALAGREAIFRTQLALCQDQSGSPAPQDGNAGPQHGNPGPQQGNPGAAGAGGPAMSDSQPKFSSDEDLRRQLRISCKVPKAAQTRDVVFRNTGEKPIPSGTLVTWYVKAGKQGGQFLMPKTLGVGADLTASELLKLGVPGQASCRSKLS